MAVVDRLVARRGYFEDFSVGMVIAHRRGKTVTEMDNVLLSQLVMNTAQGHFNREFMKDTEYGERIVFGGLVAALVIGLATEDTGEKAVRELGLDDCSFPAAVLHGDTVHALTEVLECTVDRTSPAAGLLVLRHWGVNQDDTVVFRGTRRLLVRRSSVEDGP